MPLTSAHPTSPAAPAHSCAHRRLKLPASSMIPMLPPKPDFAAVAEAATRAETNLLRWFDATPEPAIEQLGVASQVIWRLAAVRKTLSLVGLKKKPFELVPPQLTKTMRELDRLMAQLEPPPTKPPRQPANPFAPYRPLPPLPPLYPRERREKAPRESAPSSTKPDNAARKQNEKDTPKPVVACPELKNPMHTAQAAERQVNQLCKEAGLSTPAPAPATPIPDAAPATPNEPDPAHKSYTPYMSYSSDPPDPSDSALRTPRSALDTLPELPVLPHPDDVDDPEYVPDIRRLAGYIDLLAKHVDATMRPLPPVHPKAFDICPEVSDLCPTLRPKPT